MNLDAIGITSKNMQETIKFYKLFGIEFKQAGSEHHYEAVTKTGLRIMADSEELMKKINTNWKRPTGNGITLCFKESSVESVDLLFKKVTDQGFDYTKKPWDAFWGQRYCCVLDPDNNQIDIFANA